MLNTNSGDILSWTVNMFFIRIRLSLNAVSWCIYVPCYLPQITTVTQHNSHLKVTLQTILPGTWFQFICGAWTNLAAVLKSHSFEHFRGIHTAYIIALQWPAIAMCLLISVLLKIFCIICKLLWFTVICLHLEQKKLSAKDRLKSLIIFQLTDSWLFT